MIKKKEHLFLSKKDNNIPVGIVLFLMLFHGISALGQTKKDSLYQRLSRETNTQIKTDILNALSMEVKGTQLMLAMDYAKMAIELGTDNEYTRGVGIAQSNLGLFYYLNDQLDSALYWNEKAKRLLINTGDSSEISKNFNRLGVDYYLLGKIKFAAENYQEAINYSVNAKLKANAYNNLGMISKQTGDLSQAVEYHSKALSLYEMLDETVFKSKTLSNLGSCFLTKKKNKQALNAYLEAYELGKGVGDLDCIAQSLNGLGASNKAIGNNEEAAKYFQESAQIYKQKGDRKEYAQQLVNLADLLTESGKLNVALQHYDEAEKILILINDKQNLAVVYNNKGNLNIKQKKDKEAALNLEKAIALAQYANDKNFRVIIAQNLSRIYESLGNTEKALEYRKLYDIYKEEINTVAENVKYLELDQTLQSNKKDQQLEIKNQEITELSENNTYYFLALILLIFLAIGILFAYRNRIKKHQLLEENIYSIGKQIEELKSENDGLRIKLKNTENELINLNSKYSGEKEVLPENMVPLSKREYEVLLFLAEGLADKEIAEKIFVSVNTVKTHTRRIYDKLLVNNRTEAVACLNRYQLHQE
ncbi:MAG: tetratricopeptide repeat protein [Bacteroidia bacterium]|nr:tetratricopeptide repeat protein [Bacteroidia bacterium]MCF8425451.1 tetratricopeptide repeat protein [Bacteroidia bacterium]MCF8446267.1 tetratricopeptide repeat protein [Bacteroidia bacterium]